MQNDKIRSKKDRRYNGGSDSESGASSDSENETNEPAAGWLCLLLIDISLHHAAFAYCYDNVNERYYVKHNVTPREPTQECR